MGAPGPTFTVHGRLNCPGSFALTGLFVEIVDQNVGGPVRVAAASSDETGAYRVTFTGIAKDRPDLQARAWNGDDGAAVLLGVSAVRYDAGPDETLDIEIPADTATLPSEFEALHAAVGSQYSGRLADLDESDERQDITFLANRTGWDARAVAMGVLADQFAGQTAGPIAAPLYYALFRAGLPADAGVLYQTSPQLVEDVWRDAIAKGVVPEGLAGDLSSARAAFHNLAVDRSLQSRAVPGTSSLDELLDISLPGDADAKRRVADIYATDRSDPPQFWQRVSTTFDEATAARLRRNAQLARLTLNNAPLIQALASQNAGDAADVASLDLVARGLFRPESWEPLLPDTVPDRIPGETLEERKVSYAQLMAAQVRASFPTAVIAAKVGAGDLLAQESAEIRDGVQQFLSEHAGRFELGAEPVDNFIGRNADVAAPADPAVTHQIKRIQRVYQLTTHDDAMGVLLDRGLDSAHTIAQWSVDDFAAARADDLGDTGARAVHARSQQISDAVANIATSYLMARNATPLGVRLDAPILTVSGAPADPAGVIAYPSLEGLFGELDNDACEDCNSVLSPAAYLVDLLHFIERKVDPSDPHPPANPQDVLLGRRPDIAHLPLTCENTNTALPHIDLVNETLEYFVAHQLSLQGYTGHDTGNEADPARLLADPQFVDTSVYTTLAGEFHPSPLPFHRDLETARRLYESLGTQLGAAMTLLRAGDSVDAPHGGYGWRDICMEHLGLSRTQHQVLTDRALTLQQLLGYPGATATADIVTELSRVKAFARRLDVTYQEFVALLRTRVIAPAGAAPGALVLTDPVVGGGSPFEALVVQHLGDGGATVPLGVVDIVRLVRFVRLWRTLGWTIDQVDAAVTALYPAEQATTAGDDASNLARIDVGWQAVVQRLGVVVSAITRLELAVDRDLLSVLACFAPMDAFGPASLYRRLFARDELGLASSPPQPPTPEAAEDLLRAACGITSDDLAAIVDHARIDLQSELDLDAVTAIYRHAWLARTLSLDVHDLLDLIAVTGVDPFEMPEPPHVPILDLLDLRDDLGAVQTAVPDALALLWAHGTPRDDRVVHDLARGLRTAFLATDAQFAVGEGAATDRAQDVLTLIFGPTDAQTTAAMLTGAWSVDVAYTNARDVLKPAIIEAGEARIGYDPGAHRLSYLGAMTTAVRDALLAVPSTTPEFAAAVGALFVASGARAASDPSFTATDAAIGLLFAGHPDLQPLFVQFAASTDSLNRRVGALLSAVVPAARIAGDQRIGVTVISSALQLDPALASAVLYDAELLHAPGQPSAPAVVALTAVRADAADLTQGCYLDAGSTASYRLGVRTDAPAASVSLTVDGMVLALAADGAVLAAAAPLSPDPAAPPVVTLTIAGDDSAQLYWQRADQPWQPVPGVHIYSTAVLEDLRTVYRQLATAAALSSKLKLSTAQLAHLARDSSLRVDGAGWLNAVPAPVPPPDAPASGLTPVLRAAVGLAYLVTAFAPQSDQFVAALEGLPAQPVAGLSALVAATGWNSAELDLILVHLSKTTADLVDTTLIRRIHAVFALASHLQISAASLLAATTNDPGDSHVQTLRAALRGRAQEAQWLAQLQEVTDPVRQQQRDALVAYVLRELRADPARAHIDTADKLFEYFLMDVQIEPCMETSRIRNAISAVQLFIERVLMNLEAPVVSPAVIDRAQWDWMKRYRLWSANREVFLWPENWLEPELRDNQSSFFRQTMAELLQSDIADETAASALLGYLSRLEEVAKLQPCSIHYVEGDPDPGDEVAHVIARTPGAQRRYYYRRLEFGMWTPWETVDLDIEDNPITPVFWKGRLLLFWLKLLNTSAPPQPGTTTDDVPLTSLTTGQVKSDAGQNVKVVPQAALCWSEYYDGRWQPPKTSDVNSPTSFGTSFDSNGEGAFKRDLLVLGETTEGDALRVRIAGQGNGSSFLVFNTHSLPQRREDRKTDPPDVEDFAQYIREIDAVDENLSIDYRTQDASTSRAVFTRKETGPVRITAPFGYAYFAGELQSSLIRDPWSAPFFFEDVRHAFYIGTNEAHDSVADENSSFGVLTPQVDPIPIAPLTITPGIDEAPNIRAMLTTRSPTTFNDTTIAAGGRTQPAKQPQTRTQVQNHD